MKQVTTVIIGAGQSGLAMAKHLGDYESLLIELGAADVTDERRNSIQTDLRRYGSQMVLQAIHETATGRTIGRPRRITPATPPFTTTVPMVEDGVRSVFPDVPNSRWVALRLLDGDASLMEAVRSGELGALDATDEAALAQAKQFARAAHLPIDLGQTESVIGLFQRGQASLAAVGA